MNILVYCEDPTPRLTYIANYLLGTLCGFNCRISTDPSELSGFGGPSICYHHTSLGSSSIHIIPSGLLSEQGIRQQRIVTGTWRGLRTIFQTAGSLPFDIFSASFYLVSRYEEYLPHEKDLYGRYSHTNSLAYQNNFLHQPLVEQWANELRQIAAPDQVQGKRTFRYIPSYDIDMAWAYRHKGFRRNLGGLLREILRGDIKQASQRIRVLAGKQQDPFDVYEWLDALHLKYSLRPVYFFLVARENSRYDKNILPHKEPMRELIRYHSAGYRTGIHPSWRSSSDGKLLKEELTVFEQILGSPASANRFHYLAFDLPAHYRSLLQLGIQNDYSMGYGTINGFRASVSEPFFWFDFGKESQTELLVHPFCWMDANSYYEQRYTPAHAFEELKQYHDELKKLGGLLMTISHNNFLSSEAGFAGWKQVIEIFLEEVVYWDL